MKTFPSGYGQNYEAPVRPVTHASLLRDGESPFRSQCPLCPRGLLLVARSKETFRLERLDRCIVCGQRVQYQDDEIDGEPFEEGS